MLHENLGVSEVEGGSLAQGAYHQDLRIRGSM